ncbi:unnamed protein product [Orchesella dallaii]|uniref:C2H2-type domain-containing protein n=1 Tax=Orchesella dallaii TaxID=48710 RepID=A0ABP1PSD2_9HEXA
MENDMGDKDQGGSKRLREKEHDGDDEAEQNSSSSKRQRPSEERESEPSQLQPPFAPIDFDKHRPYSCELCSDKFRRHDTLEQHFRTWHEKSATEAKDLVEAAKHKYLKENPNFSTNESLQVNGRSRLHANTRDTALRRETMYPFYDPRVIENLVSMHFNYIRSKNQRHEPPGPQQLEKPNQISNSAGKLGQDITQENSQMILYGVEPYSCSSSSISSVSRSDLENESDISEEDEHNDLENTIRQNLAEYRNDIEFGPELPVSPVPFNEGQSQLSNLSVMMETEEIVSNRGTPELAQVDLNTMDADGRSEIIEEENDIVPGPDVNVSDMQSGTSSADTGETIENMQVNNGKGNDHDDSQQLHTPAQYYDTLENVEVRGNVKTVLEGDHGQQHESDGGERTSAQLRANSTTTSKDVQFIRDQMNAKKNNTKLVPNHSEILAANSPWLRFRLDSSPGSTKHVQSQEQKGSEQRELNVKIDGDQPRVAINLQQRSGKIRLHIISPGRDGYLHFHRHTRAPPPSSELKRSESEIRNGEWEQSVIPIRGVFVQAIVLLICVFLVIFWSTWVYFSSQ